MKKYVKAIVLALSLSVVTISCSDNSDNTTTVDNDTYSAVFEIKNVNFPITTNTISGNFSSTLYDADQVLIYRMSDVISENPVWELVPRTIYVDEFGGFVSYTFDFTKYDYQIYVESNLSNIPTLYTNNQTFRIVIIPGYFVNGRTASVDTKDYNAVIKHYNIDDSKIKKLSVK